MKEVLCWVRGLDLAFKLLPFTQCLSTTASVIVSQYHFHFFLQVAYQNDPEGALIQFASPDEAKRAMQSTEAVLNNRFIRVHWFRDDGSDGQGLSHSQQQPQQQPVLVRVNFKLSFITCCEMLCLTTSIKKLAVFVQQI